MQPQGIGGRCPSVGEATYGVCWGVTTDTSITLGAKKSESLCNHWRIANTFFEFSDFCPTRFPPTEL